MGSCFGLVTGLNFPSPMSPLCIEMMSFHKFLLMILIYISIFVGGVLIFFWISKFYSKLKFGNSLDFLEKKKLEIYWTLLPFFILMMIGAYSLKILYHADVASMYPPRRAKKMKVMGRQWYWSYNYFLNMEMTKRKFRSAVLAYDSYMLNLDDSSLKNFRNLEVDKPLVMQSWSLYKIMTTSSDVMHSFSLPSLGLKLDSVPGRLKEMKTMLLQPGVYYGQCSELCGVKHSFMPMKAESYKFFYKFYVNSSPRFRVPQKSR